MVSSYRASSDDLSLRSDERRKTVGTAADARGTNCHPTEKTGEKTIAPAVVVDVPEDDSLMEE